MKDTIHKLVEAIKKHKSLKFIEHSIYGSNAVLVVFETSKDLKIVDEVVSKTIKGFEITTNNIIPTNTGYVLQIELGNKHTEAFNDDISGFIDVQAE